MKHPQMGHLQGLMIRQILLLNGHVKIGKSGFHSPMQIPHGTNDGKGNCFPCFRKFVTDTVEDGF